MREHILHMLKQHYFRCLVTAFFLWNGEKIQIPTLAFISVTLYFLNVSVA